MFGFTYTDSGCCIWRNSWSKGLFRRHRMALISHNVVFIIRITGFQLESTKNWSAIRGRRTGEMEKKTHQDKANISTRSGGEICLPARSDGSKHGSLLLLCWSLIRFWNRSHHREWLHHLRLSQRDGRARSRTVFQIHH